jgi:serine/threonine-protein kinase
MPNVREMRLEQALEVLREYDLRADIQNPLDQAPVIVTRQFPAEGAEIPDDRIVLLWVEPVRFETVPSITDLPVERANAVLLERELAGEPMGREPSPLAVGRVSRQDPPAGEPVPEDRVVRYWLSLGPRVVTDVRGLPLDEALARLEENSLPGEVVGEADSVHPPGFVADQEPQGGPAVVDPRLVVQLWLSTGLPPERPEPTRFLTVPEVRNMPLERAFRTLREAGLGGEVARRQDSDLPLDFVIEQDPPGGARVEERGLVVRLVLSDGPPEAPGISPWAIGGIGLLVGLGLGALWRLLRRKPGDKGAKPASVRIIPRIDQGEQGVTTTTPVDLNLEIELRPAPDPGEQEIDLDRPLLPD